MSTSVQLPDHRDGDAFDGDVACVDGLQVGILGLQPDAVLFFEEPLDRGLIINERDYDLTVRRRRLASYNQEVSVVDAGVDHAVAANVQDETLIRAAQIHSEGEVVFDVLLRENRLSGGNVADHRDRDHLDGRNV